MQDYHTHSTYSDGSLLLRMVDAAAEAGLAGVGVADHCVLPASERQRTSRDVLGFALDHTYERRRRGIEQLREDREIRIYDAVEMDYDPRVEDEIAAFLADAGFEYALGSVHAVGDTFVQWPSEFDGMDEGSLETFVDDYYDRLVALVESELFEVAAHPDLVERTAALRGRSTVDHYRRVADAFADSRTVPEVNAGRACREPGIVHPAAEFLAALEDRGVAVTVGTDAHDPGEVGPRVDALADHVDRFDLDPVSPLAVAANE
jgi:histidinol-phosphatase (PHP family)